MAQYFEPLSPGSSPSYHFPEQRTPAARRLCDATVGIAARAARRGSLSPAILLTVLAICGVLLLQFFTVQPGQPGAVVFPAGVSEAQAFDAVIAAGGRPVRATRTAFGDRIVWIAAADDPDFFSRVVGAGAMMVINPFAFGGCLLVQS